MTDSIHPPDILLEACVETYEQAIRAEKQGAHRIELCADLSQGGLTPTRALVRQCLADLSIPIKVIIRPRGGGFVYTPKELAEMQYSIDWCLEEGVYGLVIGVLDHQNRLNLKAIQQLLQKTNGLNITIHKAIDECVDPIREIRRLKSIAGIHAVLSSGMAATALEGQAMLREMHKEETEQFKIIVAGKVTDQNIHALHQLIGAREYHGRKIVGPL